MSRSSVIHTIFDHAIIPVVALESVEAALPLADALTAGGLPLIEITFRTAIAPAAIRAIREARPRLIVGAGTVLTVADLRAACDAGAQFAVAPGLDAEIVALARELGMPFVPGVCTPSEIQHALALQCTLLKFFPAEAMGGVTTIQAMAAPYRHTAVRFIPTGGVNPGNLAAYLGTDGVAAVGGTWLARPDDLAAGRWSEIEARCHAAIEIVRNSRRQPPARFSGG